MRFKNRKYSYFVPMVQLSQLAPYVLLWNQAYGFPTEPYNVSLPEAGIVRMHLTRCLIQKALSLLQPPSHPGLGQNSTQGPHRLLSYQPRLPGRHQLCHGLRSTFWFCSSPPIIECCVCIYMHVYVNYYSFFGWTFGTLNDFSKNFLNFFKLQLSL